MADQQPDPAPWRMSVEDAERIYYASDKPARTQWNLAEVAETVHNAVALGIVPDPRQHGPNRCIPVSEATAAVERRFIPPGQQNAEVQRRFDSVADPREKNALGNGFLQGVDWALRTVTTVALPEALPYVREILLAEGERCVREAEAASRVVPEAEGLWRDRARQIDQALRLPAAEAATDAERRNFRWAYALLVALAQRHLTDANSSAPAGCWPNGQKWSGLSGSSKAIFLTRAREEAGIPQDEFLAVVRSGAVEVDDLYEAAGVVQNG
jgi:hypothetical protein